MTTEEQIKQLEAKGFGIYTEVMALALTDVPDKEARLKAYSEQLARLQTRIQILEQTRRRSSLDPYI